MLITLALFIMILKFRFHVPNASNRLKSASELLFGWNKYGVNHMNHTTRGDNISLDHFGLTHFDLATLNLYWNQFPAMCKL